MITPPKIDPVLVNAVLAFMLVLFIALGVPATLLLWGKVF